MIQFLPTSQADGSFGFSVCAEGTEAGRCTFRLEGDTMEFTAVACEDPLLTDGLLRAAMNFAANRNAYIARVRAGIHEQAFRLLGFTGGAVLTAEIPEALTGACGRNQ